MILESAKLERNKRPEVRDQKSEIRGQRSEVRLPISQPLSVPSAFSVVPLLRSFFMFFMPLMVYIRRCLSPSLTSRRSLSPFLTSDLRPLTSRRSRRLAAYTIIELLVVSGIIVLVSGLSIPMLYPLFARQSLDQAADAFKMACMRARTRAIQERINFQVEVTVRVTGEQQQTVRVKAEHWDDPAYFPTSTAAEQEYKARFAEPADFLPANTQFVNRTGTGPYTYTPYSATQTYTFTFNPLGAVAAISGSPTALTAQTDGYVLSISDTKRDRVMSLYLYTTTGTAFSEEVSQ